jgi:membrane fusion protein (multidrug efflux system)
VCFLVLVPELLLCLLAGSLGCGEPDPVADTAAGVDVEEPDAVSVEVVTVRPGPLNLEVALTGQLEAEYSVVIKPEINGVIDRITFEEGQPVLQGQVLFRLRDAEQRARLKEAEAAARLAADVYERTQRLASRDISSAARRAEASAALDEARAKIDLARLEVERTQILAPFDGVVGSLLVGPGERIEPDIGLVSIEAIEKLQLVVAIPEPSIALARIGGRIHARVIAYPDERFPAEVYYISPTVDRATRRLILKAWVQNADHRLKPGMFANVDVVVFDKDSALVVPEAAMVYDRNGTYVWRVDSDDRAHKVPVEIGIRQRGRVEILSGLESMDRVISAGVNKVMAGSLIDAVPSSVPALEEGASSQARGGQGEGVEG